MFENLNLALSVSYFSFDTRWILLIHHEIAVFYARQQKTILKFRFSCRDLTDFAHILFKDFSSNISQILLVVLKIVVLPPGVSETS